MLSITTTIQSCPPSNADFSNVFLKDGQMVPRKSYEIIMTALSVIQKETNGPMTFATLRRKSENEACEFFNPGSEIHPLLNKVGDFLWSSKDRFVLSNLHMRFIAQNALYFDGMTTALKTLHVEPK